MEGYRQAIRRKEKKNGESLSENKIDSMTNYVVKERMREVLYKKRKKSKLVDTVAEILQKENVVQAISYNYDDLVEKRLKEMNSTIKIESVYNEMMPHNMKKPIFHVHGFIPSETEEPGVPVLSEREYHSEDQFSDKTFPLLF